MYLENRILKYIESNIIEKSIINETRHLRLMYENTSERKTQMFLLSKSKDLQSLDNVSRESETE